jgi:hypothetical protein
MIKAVDLISAQLWRHNASPSLKADFSQDFVLSGMRCLAWCGERLAIPADHTAGGGHEGTCRGLPDIVA